MYEEKRFWYKANIISVHDGDTLRMDIDLGFTIHFLTPSLNNLPMSIRIYGYDAPELKTHMSDPDGQGEAALASVNNWLSTHSGPYMIHTVRDTEDKYGRYLVDVIADKDGNDLIAYQVMFHWLKPYFGSGPKPTWP